MSNKRCKCQFLDDLDREDWCEICFLGFHVLRQNVCGDIDVDDQQMAMINRWVIGNGMITSLARHYGRTLWLGGKTMLCLGESLHASACVLTERRIELTQSQDHKGQLLKGFIIIRLGERRCRSISDTSSKTASCTKTTILVVVALTWRIVQGREPMN